MNSENHNYSFVCSTHIPNVLYVYVYRCLCPQIPESNSILENAKVGRRSKKFYFFKYLTCIILHFLNITILPFFETICVNYTLFEFVVEALACCFVLVYHKPDSLLNSQDSHAMCNMDQRTTHGNKKLCTRGIILITEL